MTFARRFTLVALALALFTSTARAEAPAPAAAAPPEQEKPLIQLALLLDTSNSMDGLIDQARSQLWTVVNRLAQTKKEGQVPRLEVALYQYGNTSLDADSGWVRQMLPFTDDLDAVSEKLFALTTGGGDEYCGQVIDAALKELKWSDRPGVYKTLFIAGNEPFTQGKVDYRTACESAAKAGIVVNTIHCGSEQDGMAGQWHEGARIGGGRYLCIDQQQAIIAIAAPQDDEILKLSTALNGTYVPYGDSGLAMRERQVAQDALASTPSAAAAGAPVARAAAKSSALYRNSQWDLVDAYVNDKVVKLEDVKEEDLPEALRAMTPEERKAHLEQQAAERTRLQQQINTLNTEREKFVAEKRREAAAEAGQTLDSAILSAVDEQLAQQKFEQPK